MSRSFLSTLLSFAMLGLLSPLMPVLGAVSSESPTAANNSPARSDQTPAAAVAPDLSGRPHDLRIGATLLIIGNLQGSYYYHPNKWIGFGGQVALLEDFLGWDYRHGIVGTVINPLPDWRCQPYIKGGIGYFESKEEAWLYSSEIVETTGTFWAMGLGFRWFARHPDGSLSRFYFSIEGGWTDVISRSSSSTAALEDSDALEPLFVPGIGFGWRF